MAAQVGSTSLTRRGSMLKRDDSKSTAEGEWEMRDGKWYRKDYYAAEVEAPKVCQMCPVHLERIAILTRELEQLKILIAERERLIAELRARLQKWEIDSREWLSIRQQLERRIGELELLLQEREMLILQLNERIRILIAEKVHQVSVIAKMQSQIDVYERQMLNCKAKGFLCNCADEVATPPRAADRWYYIVHEQLHGEMFQYTPLYEGGQILVESLEGATIVNPNYYAQTEKVPGTARLRVRVADFQGAGAPMSGEELFVRLKLGEATQFTQAHPYQNQGVSWNQDMVFVEVPLKSHPFDASASCCAHPLVVEVVSRVIGTANETVVGSASLELRDLVKGLTRIMVVPLTSGGAVNLRIRAMDFGLHPLSNVVQGWMSTNATIAPPSLDKLIAGGQQQQAFVVSQTSGGVF